MSTFIWTNWTAGEASPRLNARVDLEKYYNSARQLVNMQVVPHGGAVRRPGTKFIQEVKDSSKKVSLKPFIFSDNQSYVMEWGDNYIRWYYQQGALYSGATQVEIATPYTADQVSAVKTAQSADVLYCAHLDVEPRKLARTGHTSWSMSTISFTHSTGVMDSGTVWGAGNWPGCVAFFEQRCVWGPTYDYPQTLWMSKSGDYENMQTGTSDDAGIAYTMAADKVNQINWLVPTTKLLIGTLGSEWTTGARTSLDPLTPTNIKVDRESTYGSSHIQAQLINQNTLFVGRHGRKLMEFGYSFEEDGYTGNDLTLLAEHLTRHATIINFDFAQDPDSTVWGIRSDGWLLSGTYYPPENVMAWCRHYTDGEVEDVCVIPGDTRDEVWMVVKREINGSTKRYIELLANERWDDVRDAVYVDSALTYHDPQSVSSAGATNPATFVTGSAHGWNLGDEVYCRGFSSDWESVNYRKYTLTTGTTGSTAVLSGLDASTFSTYTSGGYLEKTATALSGLDHLEGKQVQILADGAVHPPKTVSGGSITLDYSVPIAHVGLPYTSTLETQAMELSTKGGGSSQGKKKRISQVAIRFYETLGAQVGTEETAMESIPFRTSADPMDLHIPLFSGDKKVPVKGDANYAGTVVVKQVNPLPMTVLGIIPTATVYSQ
jgi:hypothetical protein